MKDADYKHRPLVALSTTGKLTPIPPRPPMHPEGDPATKTSSIPRPRIAAEQPSDAEIEAAEAAKASPIKKFLKKLIKKKT